MKKILATLTLIGLLAVPVMILAAEQVPIPGETETFENTGDLIDTITNVGNWIFTGLLVIAAIFMVLAGYFFVTGGGEPEKVNKARQMLINALIGVAVGLASRGLISVIQNIIKE